jgi:hypothetical protein
LNTGKGGDFSTGGGDGGAFSIATGNGGAAAANPGGAGGAISITAGNGGASAGGNGAGGTITLNPGASGGVGASAGNIILANLNGNVGIGTTSPYAKLSVWGPTTGRSFEVVNSASTTNLWVSATGFGTTTVTGLNISGSATSTSNVGFNLSGGCYAIGGVCLSSGTSYTNADTNAYIHASSTIAKTYTDNTFTGLQTFGNNISLGGAQLNVTGLTYGNLLSYNGTNWVNTSTSSLGISLSDTTGILAINRGGTGTSTAPSYGRLLLGNSLGGYDLVATSSLGLGSGTGTVNVGTLNRLSYYTGATAVSSANFLSIDASNSYLGIGTSTPYSKLSVWGSGTGTNRLFELTNSASTTLASILENGTAYFLGNVGIGTTSPYAKLSVAGEVVASHSCLNLQYYLIHPKKHQQKHQPHYHIIYHNQHQIPILQSHLTHSNQPGHLILFQNHLLNHNKNPILQSHLIQSIQTRHLCLVTHSYLIHLRRHLSHSYLVQQNRDF